MKQVPPILFGLGVIIAISGGARVPLAGDQWPTTWPMFAGGMALAIIALVWWRVDKARHRTEQANSADGDPFVMLANLIAPAQQLVRDVDALDAHGVCRRVDALLDGYILPFAEVRQRVIDRLGMAKGAEILVTVAYGERMLNRVWSAAGDGHLTEARACLPDAVDAFAEADRMAKAA